MNLEYLLVGNASNIRGLFNIKHFLVGNTGSTLFGWFKKEFKNLDSYKRSKDLSDEELIKVHKYLRRRIVGMRPLLAVSKENEELIYQATEEQLDVLHTIDINSRVLCSGPAGSGKTIIAVEIAKKSINNNKQQRK